jgi:hypothetical protein
VGLALAQPTFARARRSGARVVVVDRSRSARDGAAVSDSARAVFRPGDALVVFDSSAREVARATADSIAATEVAAPQSGVRGSLSAALVAASRAADRLSRAHDSVEIVIISPVTTDELDAATTTIRNQWAGPVRVIRGVGVRADTIGLARPDVRASTGDPVAAALSLVGAVVSGEAVRVRRDTLSAADSAWARAGGVLVAWPAAGKPVGWTTRARPDTAYVVVAGGASENVGAAGPVATVIAPFERRLSPPAGRVVARWGDGEPAATEVALGSGCVRAVAVPVSAAGDLALTPVFRHFTRRMAGPCGGQLPLALTPDSVVARVVPASPKAASTNALAPRDRVPSEPSRAVAWLLGMALALAVAELFLRKGESHAAA